MDAPPPPFAVCGSCKATWPSWEAFLFDPGVRMLGLQATAKLPETNLLVFEHACGSSLSVLARRLRHLIDEARPAPGLPTLFETDTCRHHCRLIEDLDDCDQPCANARDRHLAVLLYRMKRDGVRP